PRYNGLTRRRDMIRHAAFVLTSAAISVAIPSAARAATPINDLGSGLYLGQYQGGLYPNGSNDVPAAHALEGRARANQIGPVNTAGQPDPAGKFVFLSVGMSNTSQEFAGV